MYRITDGQFNDVVIQENGLSVDGKRIIPPFQALCGQAESVLPDSRLYGRLLKVGERDGHPILTFTATKSDFHIGSPSEAYLKLIVAGLEETYPCMRKTYAKDRNSRLFERRARDPRQNSDRTAYALDSGQINMPLVCSGLRKSAK
jgi:hypothetical protein